jgi:hypothetical protein
MAERPQREEALAAMGTSVRRKMQQAPQPNRPAFRNMPALDALQLEVSADSAMGVPDIRHGDAPSIEAGLTLPAAPGAQTE